MISLSCCFIKIENGIFITPKQGVYFLIFFWGGGVLRVIFVFKKMYKNREQYSFLKRLSTFNLKLFQTAPQIGGMFFFSFSFFRGVVFKKMYKNRKQYFFNFILKKTMRKRRKLCKCILEIKVDILEQCLHYIWHGSVLSIPLNGCKIKEEYMVKFGFFS